MGFPNAAINALIGDLCRIAYLPYVSGERGGNSHAKAINFTEKSGAKTVPARGTAAPPAIPPQPQGWGLSRRRLMTSDHRESQLQMILCLGAEGGSISLYGIQQVEQGQWTFFLETDERTFLDILSAEDAEGLELFWRSEDLKSWDEALDLLNDRYPNWPLLSFIEVHPDFKDRLFAAARQRLYDRSIRKRSRP